MTELEKMIRAREYVRKLANGIDPLTDAELSAGSAYDNVRISRCMFYVAEILDKVIANGGEIGGKSKKKYYPTSDDANNLKPHTDNLAITKFIQHLQSQLPEGSGSIPREPIINWLVKKELLREITTGKNTRRLASDTGLALGIQNVEAIGQYGTYTAVYYTPSAQQLIIDALPEIFSEQGVEQGNDCLESKT